MPKMNIEILNRIEIRRRELERPSSDEHVYEPEHIPLSCTGCTTKIASQARPMRLKPGDVFSLTHDPSSHELTLTGERRNGNDTMPIFFRLKYAYRLPDLQPFEVATLQCRILKPSTLGPTVDRVLKMLCPRQKPPLWEPQLPLDRHTEFSSIASLKVGITMAK